MPFEIVRNDIVTMPVDAIVNAANCRLASGGGVCGAIFAAAGHDQLACACRAIGHCDVGQAVITDGFSLPARYVIHAVGPIWQGGAQNEAALLKSCYTNALLLAEKEGCQSIAFPLISAGICGYPRAEALKIAVNAIGAFLFFHEMQIYLTVFERSAVILDEQLQADIQSYIDGHYVRTYRDESRRNMEPDFHAQRLTQQHAGRMPMAASMSVQASLEKKKRSLKDLLGNLDESFSQMLLRLIDEKGMTDVEVYKRANMDRKLFSKIRRDGHNPSKQTAIALAIALRLNLDETRDLLSRAGYSLSHSSKFDVIIEYFLEEGVYDIYEINEALFAFDQRLLGA